MGSKVTLRLLDNTGGVNLRASELRTNQSETQTEWLYLQNVNTYQDGGFAGQKGNAILNATTTDETAILGIGAYQKSDETWWVIYQKASGKAYVMPLDGGAETEIKTGLSTSGIPQFVQFNGRAIAVNGVNIPWTWDGTTAANVTNPNTAWASSGYPSTIANIDGGRLVAAANSASGQTTLYYCDQGNQNEWRSGVSGVSTLVVVDPYADAADIIALKEYGAGVTAHTTNNRIYLLSGNTLASYAITPVASNQAGKGKLSITNYSGSQYIYTGTGIIQLRKTDLGQIQIGENVDIASKIQPFLTADDLIYPITPVTASTQASTILLTLNETNALVAYFKTGGSSAYNLAGIFDFNKGAWTFRQATPITAAGVVNNRLITGTSTGRLLREFTGGSFVSATLERKIVTPWITLGAPDIRKDLKKVTVYTRANSDAALTLNYRLNYQPTIVKTVTLQGSTTSAKYGTAVYGTSVYSGATIQMISRADAISGQAIQLEITSEDENEDFKILGLSLVLERAGDEL
jgi:hypothetical protein